MNVVEVVVDRCLALAAASEIMSDSVSIMPERLLELPRTDEERSATCDVRLLFQESKLVLWPSDSREANEWFVTTLEAFCVALATFDEIVVNNSPNDCMYVALLSDV